MELISANAELELPEILAGMEFAFLVGLLRKATKEPIVPLRATAKREVRNPSYGAFLGTGISVADKDQMFFAKSDTLLPFISCNESMWRFFEPELNRRLSMLETDDSYATRVRSALIELLPSGACTIEDVAKKLGYSKRSLQRKLQEEQTNFQKQLNHTRELLAKYYVGSTEMRTEDIAYLLGYQDTSSFLRAFAVWPGDSVRAYRQRQR